jgi:hypothetical protein
MRWWITERRGVIIALAGRRIDPPDAATPRFPLENVSLVTQRLRALFNTRTVKVVVSSAACGADLLALSVAGQVGIRRRVILPFGRDKFRETSVVDRPGDWGPVYDRVLDEASATGDIVTLEGTADDAEAYAAANDTILKQAAALAQSGEETLATLVWEGGSRGSDDLTAAFGAEARKRGLTVIEVGTR